MQQRNMPKNLYRELYMKIICVHCSSEQLLSLKIIFKNEINSNRTFSKINSLADLLKVLEKRTFIGPPNIDNLIKIGSNFGIHHDCEAKNVIKTSDKNGVTNIISNNKRCNIQNEEVMQILPTYSRDPVRKIYKLISEEIGAKWKDFARALTIREGSIDELMTRYERVSERVNEILLYHETTCCDKRLWKSKLLEALLEVRRNDLRKEIQLIFDTN